MRKLMGNRIYRRLLLSLAAAVALAAGLLFLPVEQGQEALAAPCCQSCWPAYNDCTVACENNCGSDLTCLGECMDTCGSQYSFCIGHCNYCVPPPPPPPGCCYEWPTYWCPAECPWCDWCF